MKKLLAVLLACVTTANAGLITHTDYTSGSVITAAGQNSNENAIVNEINGNITSVNITDGGIATIDLGDSQVTMAKLDTVIQSTITAVAQINTYRRPRIQYISVTTVDIENNTGTSNETCVLFNDGMRCVTENTASTSQYRRFIITEVAANSGTHNSGLSGAVEANNTWYHLYAWKTSDNTARFVVSGSTNSPTQANFAALNTMYGTNAWVYLGRIANGDNSAAGGDIKNFEQSGNLFLFEGAATGVAQTLVGLRMNACSAAGSCTWSYTSGTTVPAIPSDIRIGIMSVGVTNNAGGYRVQNADGNIEYISGGADSVSVAVRLTPHSVAQGIKAVSGDGGNENYDIVLTGFFDPHLANGSNPQL